MGSITSFLDASSVEDWRKDHKTKLVGFPILLVLDFIGTIALSVATLGFQNPATFFYGLGLFETDVTDLVLLSFFRCFFLPILTLYGIKVGSTKAPNEKSKDPLSVVKGAKEENNETRIKLTEDLDSDIVIHATKKKEEEKQKEEEDPKSKAELYKKIIVGIIFFYICSNNLVVGIKGVLFQIPPTAPYWLCGILLGSGVLLMTLELWLANEIIDALTRDSGVLFPQIHAHPLYYTKQGIIGHWCDYCRARGLREAFSCRSCDYDLCLECTKKQGKSGGEGVLRNDNGVQIEKEVTNWEYVKKAFKYVRPHWVLLAAAFSFLLVTSATRISLPNFQGKIFDNVINYVKARDQKDSDQFTKDVISYLVLSIFLGIFGSLRNFCFGLVGIRMTNVVRTELYKSIIKQDIAFFDGASTGDLTSRLGENTRAMVNPIQTMLSTLLSSFFSLIGGLVMCLNTSWRLSILAFTTIGPISLLFKEYSEWSNALSREMWAYTGDANSTATQMISNIRTVRAFSQEPREMVKYDESISEALAKGERDALARAGTFALTEHLDLFISILILWYGGSVVMKDTGELTIGNLITFQLYWTMLNSSYNSLTDVWSSFTRAGGAAQRIMSLLDLEPAIEGDSGAIVDPAQLKGDIELRDVEFSYQMRPEAKVLKGINLSIGSGQVCAFVGKSGGGKSTIINLLLRFYDPRNGAIMLDGTNLKDLNPISYRRNIGLVSQDTELFNTTIEENIAYGVESYTRKQLIKAAKQANAHDFISAFEDGYATRIGERGTRISGGQKQRIALARVFLREPKLLFLDEATSALDAESEALVQEAIDRMFLRELRSLLP